MSNLKIKRTVYPTETLSYNDWVKEFKVSSLFYDKPKLSNKGQRFCISLKDARQ